jgi:hypothetical protein
MDQASLRDIPSVGSALDHVWLCVKSAAELLYFLAGVVVAGAAVYAAQQVKAAKEQLKLTKEIADRSAKRESAKLAGEYCKHYADQVVPAYNKAGKAYTDGECNFLSAAPLLRVYNMHSSFTTETSHRCITTQRGLHRNSGQHVVKLWSRC